MWLGLLYRQKTSKEPATAVSGSSLWRGPEKQLRVISNRTIRGIFRSLIFKNITFLFII